MASLLWSLQILNLAFVDFSIVSKISGSVTQDGVWFRSLAHHQRRSAHRSEFILVSGGWMGRSRTLHTAASSFNALSFYVLNHFPHELWTMCTCFLCRWFPVSFEHCTEFVWVKQQEPAMLVYRIRPGMSADATGEVGGPPECGVNLWTKSDSVCTPDSRIQCGQSQRCWSYQNQKQCHRKRPIRPSELLIRDGWVLLSDLRVSGETLSNFLGKFSLTIKTWTPINTHELHGVRKNLFKCLTHNTEEAQQVALSVWTAQKVPVRQRLVRC